MTPRQTIELRQSERRERLNELAGLDELSDEQTAELDKLSAEFRTGEKQLRAAILTEEQTQAAAEAQADAGDGDREVRARLELRSKARLGNYLAAALSGRAVEGAEAELAAAAGVSGIPLELFDVERRAGVETRADAASAAPASSAAVNLRPILPSIFARSIVPRLGVAMPRVEAGTYASLTITTDLTAKARDKGQAQESTAAQFAAVNTTPHRVSARLSVRIEDVAGLGAGNFESILRQNLMLAMSSELDRLGLVGDPGTVASEPKGLFTQLTDPANPATVIDWAGFVALAADGIDGGPWAEDMTAVRLLVNAETMRKAETTFRIGLPNAMDEASQDTPGELSAAAYLREHCGGLMASARMPATAANIASVIRHRSGTMGLDGVDAVTTATCPTWAELAIDDIYSDAASGTRHFTIHALIGDVVRHYPAAYERIDVKLA